jgi:hypothetical protein
MISVQEVILDPDMIAPEPFTILRSTGQFALGGFETVTVPIQLWGPVQQASNKEIQMLPEADRVGSIRAFWSRVPVYLTRGTAPAPGTHSEAPAGSVPGSTFTLSAAPPGDVGNFYVNGLFQTPGVDYTLAGNVITTTNPVPTGALLLFTWPITQNVADAASDIIVYPPGGEQFRVLARYFDPGSGFWKALGTRMNAA